MNLEDVVLQEPKEEGQNWLLTHERDEVRVAKELSLETIQNEIQVSENWQQLRNRLYFLVAALVFKP